MIELDNLFFRSIDPDKENLENILKIFDKLAKSEKIGRFEFGPFSHHIDIMKFAPHRYLPKKKHSNNIYFLC